MSAPNYQEAWAQLRKRLEPARLSNLQTNADIIAHYVYRNGLNGSDVNDLLKSVWALHAEGKLLWDVDPVPPPAPKAKSRQELAAETYRKDLAARNEAHQQNVKPLTKEEKEQAAKKAGLEKQIAHCVSTYSVNGSKPGMTDHEKSRLGREYLAAIKVSIGGKFNLELTCRCVCAAFVCESVADMRRAVERELSNYNNENNPDYHKQRQRERESRHTVGPVVRNYAE